MPGQNQEKPPLFRQWRTWYFLLLAFLVFLIAVFYLFMKIFS
jgi:hypothetical protein